MRRSNWVVSVALAGIATLAIAGCAAEGDVDRTQPGRVSKAIFTGEWYYRQFVTDVPANTGFDMIGSQGTMDRVKWRITENALVAYRAYASIPGSENAWTNGQNDLSAPIAAFNIQSHFDVKRSYNSATGEQTNVIYEDSSDRPWFEREYMRVDWTRNTLFTVQSMNADYYGSTPEAYIPEISNEIDPDRLLITPGYIDVTTRFQLSEEACGGTDSWNNCSPASIKVRSSFLKIDKVNKKYLAIDDNNKQNYVPLDYRDGLLLKDDMGRFIPAIALNDGQHPCAEGIAALGGPSSGYTQEEDCTPARVEMFAKFGFFRTERVAYDREYDITEQGKIYLANRWNIWDGAQKDAAGAPIPYAQRKTRQVTYYLNTQFPEDLFGAAQLLGADYNRAFKDTVAALLINEENSNAGATNAEIRARAETLPEIYLVKQNSCNVKSFTADPNDPDFANKDFSFVATPSTKDWANAHPTAKAAALAAMKRAGQTLKDDLSDLSEQNVERFCTALEDATLTAEKDEDRFVWQRIGDLRFPFINYIVRDQLAGPLGFGPSDPDPITGELINANANVYGAAMDTYAASSVEMVQVLNGEITLQDLIQGQDIVTAVAQNTALAKQRAETPLEPAQFQKLVASLPNQEELGQLKNVLPGQMLRNMARIRGTALETKLVNEDMALLDPDYRPGQPVTQATIDKVTPARRWDPQYKRIKNRWDRAMNVKGRNTCMYLADFADDSIIGWAMEMKGRNMTRKDMITKARQDIFLGLTEHEVGHTVGLRHNFEGSTDALNYFDDFWLIRKQFPKAEWPRHRLAEYGYSTVMDYTSHFNSDVHGLGKYDLAAIKFGYGQISETFPTTAVASAGDVLDSQLFVGNYESIPQMFRNNIDNIKDRLNVPYGTVIDQVRSTLMNNRPVNTREVPYRFCSDEYRGNLTCKTWDEGASQSEIVQNAANMYRNYWYFSAFKRDRIMWDLGGYLDRIEARYFQHFSTAYQYFYYYGRYYSNQFFGQDLARAAVDGMNTLTEVIATPDTGNYCAPRADCIAGTFAASCPSSTPIDTSPVWKNYSSTYCEGGAAGTQKIGMTMFNGAKPFYLGFSDDYYYYFTRSGSLYEKDVALYSLMDSEAQFYRVDTIGDRRNYSINYFRTWREPMLAILNGVVMNRSNEYGGTIQAGKYVPPAIIDYASSGTGLMPNVTAPRIASRVTYTSQYYGMLYAMASLNSTLDDSLDISNYLRLSLKGTPDDIIYDSLPPSRLIELTDPRTNTTYRAAQTDDGRSIAYNLLLDAKTYMDGTFTAARTAYLSNPTNPTAIANWQNAQTNLSSRLETIDDVRLFYDVFASGQQ